MPIGDFFRGATRGTQERDKSPTEQADAGEMKIPHAGIELEPPFRQETQDMPAKRIGIDGFAIRSQPHDDIFVLIGSKSKIAGDGRIELTQRMREWSSLESRETAFLAHCHQSRVCFRRPVHYQHRRTFKGRSKECTGSVAEMVIEKDRRRPPETHATPEFSP
jgi:hypothetical protein